jgi:alpha-glucoside transport system substrate-binding protein
MFKDRPQVRTYMEYLTTGISVEPVARAGGALFPHRDQDLGWYPSDLERTMAELAMNAEIVRFDASDLMPPEIGAGAFWAGMVDWVEGVELEAVLDRIEESWP